MKKKLLGKISVDSGQLMIVDPCYMHDWDHKRDYTSACDATDNDNEPYGQCFQNLAVCSCTFAGDGEYKVYGLFDGSGKRPYGIFIDMRR